MKDWKIWSKREKEFIYPKKLHGKLPVCYDFYSGDLFFGCNDAVDGLSKDEFIFLEDIGLKDIDGKSIYADSSIVEFDFEGHPNMVKLQGYFSFNIEYLMYVIKLLPIGGFKQLEYCANNHKISNIKIIDTIQENKLGLIK